MGTKFYHNMFDDRPELCGDLRLLGNQYARHQKVLNSCWVHKQHVQNKSVIPLADAFGSCIAVECHPQDVPSKCTLLRMYGRRPRLRLMFKSLTPNCVLKADMQALLFEMRSSHKLDIVDVKYVHMTPSIEACAGPRHFVSLYCGGCVDIGFTAKKIRELLLPKNNNCLSSIFSEGVYDVSSNATRNLQISKRLQYCGLLDIDKDVDFHWVQSIEHNVGHVYSENVQFNNFESVQISKAELTDIDHSIECIWNRLLNESVSAECKLIYISDEYLIHFTACVKCWIDRNISISFMHEEVSTCTSANSEMNTILTWALFKKLFYTTRFGDNIESVMTIGYVCDIFKILGTSIAKIKCCNTCDVSCTQAGYAQHQVDICTSVVRIICRLRYALKSALKTFWLDTFLPKHNISAIQQKRLELVTKHSQDKRWVSYDIETTFKPGVDSKVNKIICISAAIFNHDPVTPIFKCYLFYRPFVSKKTFKKFKAVKNANRKEEIRGSLRTASRIAMQQKRRRLDSSSSDEADDTEAAGDLLTQNQIYEQDSLSDPETEDDDENVKTFLSENRIRYVYSMDNIREKLAAILKGCTHIPEEEHKEIVMCDTEEEVIDSFFSMCRRERVSVVTGFNNFRFDNVVLGFRAAYYKMLKKLSVEYIQKDGYVPQAKSCYIPLDGRFFTVYLPFSLLRDNCYVTYDWRKGDVKRGVWGGAQKCKISCVKATSPAEDMDTNSDDDTSDIENGRTYEGAYGHTRKESSCSLNKNSSPKRLRLSEVHGTKDTVYKRHMHVSKRIQNISSDVTCMVDTMQLSGMQLNGNKLRGCKLDDAAKELLNVQKLHDVRVQYANMLRTWKCGTADCIETLMAYSFDDAILPALLVKVLSTNAFNTSMSSIIGLQPREIYKDRCMLQSCTLFSLVGFAQNIVMGDTLCDRDDSCTKELNFVYDPVKHFQLLTPLGGRTVNNIGFYKGLMTVFDLSAAYPNAMISNNMGMTSLVASQETLDRMNLGEDDYTTVTLQNVLTTTTSPCNNCLKKYHPEMMPDVSTVSNKSMKSNTIVGNEKAPGVSTVSKKCSCIKSNTIVSKPVHFVKKNVYYALESKVAHNMLSARQIEKKNVAMYKGMGDTYMQKISRQKECAVKLVANALYGALLVICPLAGSAIPHTVRDIIESYAHMVFTEIGAKIASGDTDSVFTMQVNSVQSKCLSVLCKHLGIDSKTNVNGVLTAVFKESSMLVDLANNGNGVDKEALYEKPTSIGLEKLYLKPIILGKKCYMAVHVDPDAPAYKSHFNVAGMTGKKADRTVVKSITQFASYKMLYHDDMVGCMIFLDNLHKYAAISLHGQELLNMARDTFTVHESSDVSMASMLPVHTNAKDGTKVDILDALQNTLRDRQAFQSVFEDVRHALGCDLIPSEMLASKERVRNINDINNGNARYAKNMAHIRGMLSNPDDFIDIHRTSNVQIQSYTSSLFKVLREGDKCNNYTIHSECPWYSDKMHNRNKAYGSAHRQMSIKDMFDKSTESNASTRESLSREEHSTSDSSGTPVSAKMTRNSITAMPTRYVVPKSERHKITHSIDQLIKTVEANIQKRETLIKEQRIQKFTTVLPSVHALARMFLALKHDTRSVIYDGMSDNADETENSDVPYAADTKWIFARYGNVDDIDLERVSLFLRTYHDTNWYLPLSMYDTEYCVSTLKELEHLGSCDIKDRAIDLWSIYVDSIFNKIPNKYIYIYVTLQDTSSVRVDFVKKRRTSADISHPVELFTYHMSHWCAENVIQLGEKEKVYMLNMHSYARQTQCRPYLIPSIDMKSMFLVNNDSYIAPQHDALYFRVCCKDLPTSLTCESDKRVFGSVSCASMTHSHISTDEVICCTDIAVLETVIDTSDVIVSIYNNNLTEQTHHQLQISNIQPVRSDGFPCPKKWLWKVKPCHVNARHFQYALSKHSNDYEWLYIRCMGSRRADICSDPDLSSFPLAVVHCGDNIQCTYTSGQRTQCCVCGYSVDSAVTPVLPEPVADDTEAHVGTVSAFNSLMANRSRTSCDSGFGVNDKRAKASSEKKH